MVCILVAGSGMRNQKVRTRNVKKGRASAPLFDACSQE